MTLKRLEDMISNEKYSEAVAYIEADMVEVLSNHNLFKTFKMLNNIPEGYFTSNMSVLIYAALSFACGNNRGLILMIEKVIVENFQSSDEEVFYYAIRQ